MIINIIMMILVTFVMRIITDITLKLKIIIIIIIIIIVIPATKNYN